MVMARHTIVHLPTEILALVCTLLCPHCYPEDNVFTEQVDVSRLDSGKSLRSFGKTCSRIRRIVAPFLFHLLSESNWELFLHLAMEDKNTIKGVRMFDMASSVPLPQASNVCTRGEEGRPRTDHIFSSGDNDVWDYDDTYFEKSEAEMMMAVLPNLEVLILDIDNFGEKTVTRLLSSHSTASCGCILTFPRLKRLDIRSKDDEWFIHHSNPVMQWLMKGASNLEELRLQNIDLRTAGASAAPSLALALNATHGEWSENAEFLVNWVRNLRSFVLVDCFLENDQLTWLKNMLSNCENLECFGVQNTYYGQGLGPEIWPCRILETILETSTNLTELSLHMKGILYTQNRNAAQYVCQADQLAGFVRLKTLKIHEDAFCRGHSSKHEDDDNGDSTIDDWSCLTRIVPKTIKDLVIWLDKDMPSLKDLTHFAEHVVAGDFPSLTHTNIIFSDHDSLPPEDKTEMCISAVSRAILRAFRGNKYSIVTVSAGDSHHYETVGRFGK